MAFRFSSGSGASDFKIMTNAARLAYTPYDGLTVYDTTHKVTYQYTTNRWHVVGVPDPKVASYYFTDFGGSANTSDGWGQLVSGTGAVVAAGSTDAQNIHGVLNVIAGTDAAGRATIQRSITAVYLGASVGFFETKLKVSALSTTTNEYILWAGLGDANTTGDHTDGVSVMYDHLNSGDFWLGRNSLAGVHTTQTSSIVPTTSWTTLRCEWTASAASFYIDGVSTGAALATNFPSSGTALHGPVVKMISSASSGASKNFQIDYFEMLQVFTTPR